VFTLNFCSDFEKQKKKRNKRKRKRKEKERNHLMLLGRGPTNPLLLWRVRPEVRADQVGE
jgi:hypothetical protein